MQNQITELKINNPSSINQKEQEIISEIIQEHPSELWTNKQNYKLYDTSTFTLSNNIMFCKKQNMFKVFNTDSLGSTKQSMVFEINYSFKITKDKKMEFIKCNPEVVKVIKNIKSKDNLESFKKKVEYEFKQSSLIKHLNIKEDIYLTSEEAYIVMAKMPGMCFFSFLKLFLSKQINLYFAFQLSYAVLVAIREQVTNYGLVHLDIKPENLIIDTDINVDLTSTEKTLPNLQSNYLKIYCVDYAYSENLNQENPIETPRCKGSPMYVSPEVLNIEYRKYKEKPDVYAAGIILQYIWKTYLCYSTERLLTTDQLKSNYKKISEEYIFNLTEKIFNQICILIINMVKANPNERCSLEQAINMLEYIIENSKIDHNIVYMATIGHKKAIVELTQENFQNFYKNHVKTDYLLDKKLSIRPNSIPYFNHGESNQSISSRKLADNRSNIFAATTQFSSREPQYEKKFQVGHESAVIYNKLSLNLRNLLSATIVELKNAASNKVYFATQNPCLKNKSGNIWPFWSNNSNNINIANIANDFTTKIEIK